MSYLSPPQTETGATLTFANPGSTGSTVSPVNTQIRNASAWVVTVQGTGRTYLIDPFTAATIAISTGQPLSVLPALDAFTGLPNGYISVEWLLPNEDPTEPDGPLTAAATVSAIEGTVQVQALTEQLIPISLTLPPNVTIAAGTGSLTFVSPIALQSIVLEVGTIGVTGAGSWTVQVENATGANGWPAVTAGQTSYPQQNTNVETFFINLPIICNIGDTVTLFFSFSGLGSGGLRCGVWGSSVDFYHDNLPTGPTNYAAVDTTGTANTTIIAAGTSGVRQIRIWTAQIGWMVPASVAGGGSSINVGGGTNILWVPLTVATANTPLVGAVSTTFPGGLPVPLGANPLILSSANGAGSIATGAISYSIDVN